MEHREASAVGTDPKQSGFSGHHGPVPGVPGGRPRPRKRLPKVGWSEAGWLQRGPRARDHPDWGPTTRPHQVWFFDFYKFHFMWLIINLSKL